MMTMIEPLVILILILIVAPFAVTSFSVTPSHTLQHRHYHNHHAASKLLHMGLTDQQLGSFEPLLLSLPSKQERRVVLENYLDRGLIPFYHGWDRQKELLQHQVQRLQSDATSSSFPSTNNNNNNDQALGCDHILLVQHSPVYTLGTSSDDKYILSTNTPTPIVRMDRGGEVTYHGPGQLTVYPVLDLRQYRQDIHWYMRALEQVVLVSCHKLGLPAERQDDTTGVWIHNRKVAAVGIKCSKWITQHGLAINVMESSLQGFENIVPCGLEGRQVGCLNQFLDKPISVLEFTETVKEALEEVFCIQLVQR
jgi:lipoyl(octanoyl) transferase